jgi:hypothetical protein
MNREKKELFEFCRHKLNNDTLVFDEILNIYDRVYDFLEECYLPLKYDKKILLIKLTYLVYKNSKLIDT